METPDHGIAGNGQDSPAVALARQQRPVLTTRRALLETLIIDFTSIHVATGRIVKTLRGLLALEGSDPSQG